MSDPVGGATLQAICGSAALAVLAASLGAGIASFASVASALPVLDALAIRNAAPPTVEEVQWRGGWGWGWGAPVAAGVVAGALDVALQAFEPAPWPVNLVYGGGQVLPLKLRAFLDFAAPRLKARLLEIA